MINKAQLFKRSYVKIKFIGTKQNLIKILTELNRKKIEVRNVNIGDNKLICKIRSGSYHIAEGAAELFNTDICRVNTYGLLGGMHRMAVNSAVIIGFIIGIAIVSIIGQYLLKIDIKCDNATYLGQIEQLVSESGVKLWKPTRDINCDQVERILVESIDEVVMATVYKDGISVVVDVVTTSQAELPPIKQDKLISEYDGIITRIIVTSGTASVKVNDRVMKGDTLIDGYINTNKGDYQEPGDEVKVPVNADGEVYAKVYYSKRLYAEDNMVLTKRTNNVKMIREYYIRGKLLGKEHNPPYDRYEKVTKSSKIDFILPITVATHYYYEVIEEVIPYEAYKEEMLIKIKSEMYDELPPASQVLKEWVIVDPNNKAIIDYYMEVEQRIDNGGRIY